MTDKLDENQMLDLIKARIVAVASQLAIDEASLYKYLPHLAPDSTQTFSLEQHASQILELPLHNYIDHTILKPEATAADIERLCEEAKRHQFAAVCVNGCRVDICKQKLEGSNVRVAAVIGFPLGADEREIKERAAERLFSEGVDEIDMVLNVGKLKDRDYHYVHKDIHHVVNAAGANNTGKLVKVILETCLLTPEEIVDACILSVMAGAQFVKTSTGFGSVGAKISDVKLMKLTVGNAAKVKASGGIRTTADALNMLKAGASRLGTSASVAIVQN